MNNCSSEINFLCIQFFIKLKTKVSVSNMKINIPIKVMYSTPYNIGIKERTAVIPEIILNAEFTDDFFIKNVTDKISNKTVNIADIKGAKLA